MSGLEWLKILSFTCSKQRPRSFQSVNKLFHLHSLRMKKNPPWTCLPSGCAEFVEFRSSWGGKDIVPLLASCIFLTLPAFPYRFMLLVSAESSSITSKHLRVWFSIPTSHSKNKGFERWQQDLHACSLAPVNYGMAIASPAAKRKSWKYGVGLKLCSSLWRKVRVHLLFYVLLPPFTIFRNEME